jgi:hypothetical protein
MTDRVLIARCPRCSRLFSVVPPQTEAVAKAVHNAVNHASPDQPHMGAPPA